MRNRLLSSNGGPKEVHSSFQDAGGFRLLIGDAPAADLMMSFQPVLVASYSLG